MLGPCCFCFAAFSGRLPLFSLLCRGVWVLESANSESRGSHSGCCQEWFSQGPPGRTRPWKTPRKRRKPEKRGAGSLELGGWSEESTAWSDRLVSTAWKRGAWSQEHAARSGSFQLVLKLGARRWELGAGRQIRSKRPTLNIQRPIPKSEVPPSC